MHSDVWSVCALKQARSNLFELNSRSFHSFGAKLVLVALFGPNLARTVKIGPDLTAIFTKTEFWIDGATRASKFGSVRDVICFGIEVHRHTHRVLRACCRIVRLNP